MHLKQFRVPPVKKKNPTDLNCFLQIWWRCLSCFPFVRQSWSVLITCCSPINSSRKERKNKRAKCRMNWLMFDVLVCDMVIHQPLYIMLITYCKSPINSTIYEKVEKQKRKRNVESKKLFFINRLMFDVLVCKMVICQYLYIVERLKCFHGI